jgi:hypothetical protein
MRENKRTKELYSTVMSNGSRFKTEQLEDNTKIVTAIFNDRYYQFKIKDNVVLSYLAKNF